jgi:hypothetical protein
MEAISIDNEFGKYWTLLSVNEKKSLLSVAKNYVELKEDTGPINLDQYNKEIEEAMQRMDKGEFYTHEEVVHMSKSWLNDK